MRSILRWRQYNGYKYQVKCFESVNSLTVAGEWGALGALCPCNQSNCFYNFKENFMLKYLSQRYVNMLMKGNHAIDFYVWAGHVAYKTQQLKTAVEEQQTQAVEKYHAR